MHLVFLIFVSGYSILMRKRQFSEYPLPLLDSTDLDNVFMPS